MRIKEAYVVIAISRDGRINSVQKRANVERVFRQPIAS